MKQLAYFKDFGIQKFSVNPRTQGWKESIVQASLLPVRICQAIGLFPLSLKKDGIEIGLPFLSIPVLLWFGYLVAGAVSLTSMFVAQDRWNSWMNQYESKGRTTFQVVNQIWWLIGLTCPFIGRLYMFRNRLEFVPFWTRFQEMLTQFETSLNLLDDKFKRKVRFTLRLHLLLALLLAFLGSLSTTSAYLETVTEQETVLKAALVIWDFMNGFLTDLVQSYYAVLLWYFVAVYRLCILALLKKAQKTAKQDLGALVKLYSTLDENVDNFNALFGSFMTIVTLYLFGMTLYTAYFMYISVTLDGWGIGVYYVVCTVVTLFLVFNMLRYSSELTEGSKMFCKILQFSSLRAPIASHFGAMGVPIEVVSVQSTQPKGK